MKTTKSQQEAHVKYVEKLQGLTDEQYLKEAESAIWLSAFASNNPRSVYHGQADACYDEANRRGNPELYKKAWEQARGQ